MENAFNEQTKEQLKAEDLHISDKANELKQTEGIFPKNLLNDLIHDELKNIIDLQDSIELDKLDYKNYDFNKISLLVRFLRDIYTKKLSIEHADNKQSDLFRMLGILSDFNRNIFPTNKIPNTTSYVTQCLKNICDIKFHLFWQKIYLKLVSLKIIK